jgi:hypothetical protein
MNSCIFTGKMVYGGKGAGLFTSKASFDGKKILCRAG